MRFAVQAALVFVLGLWSRFFPGVRELPAGARAAVYFAAGLVTLTLEMWIGLPWSRSAILAVPLIAAIVSYVKFPPRRTQFEWPNVLSILAIAIFTAAVLSGAATSFDLLLFWGPKAQAFALARNIDLGFLAAPEHYLMHPDYPPLVPLFYAWTSVGAQLNWWGVVLTAPLFLALATLAVRRHSALFASLFGWLFLINAVGGNGEPALIFFETLALVAIEDVSLLPVTAIALTGAVLTKVEGAAFVAVIVIAFALRQRRILVAAIPAVVATGAWLVWCRVHHLVEAYAPAAASFSPRHLPEVATLLLRDAALRSAYLPWIVLAILIALGSRRAARSYVGAAALYAGFLLYLYSRDVDPAGHIAWSASRVLITPLVLLFGGAMAKIAGPCPKPISPPRFSTS